jgi:large subunit ribosomal protein L31
MKPGIHPNYVESTVTCACGNVFTTRSTKPQLRTDLCNVCHPFYTGEQRIVDTAGQVERFMKRMEMAAQTSRPTKRQVRLAARAERESEVRRRVAPGSEVEDAEARAEAPAETAAAGVSAPADAATAGATA